MTPRFMTDAQLQEHFGLSERALYRIKLARGFPQRDRLIGKTDSKAVEHFFDQRAGLALAFYDHAAELAKENWD